MLPLLPRGCVRPIQRASPRGCLPVARSVRRHLPPSPNPPSATARHRTGWQRLAARAQTPRGYVHAGFRDGQLALKYDNSQSVSFELTRNWHAIKALNAIGVDDVAATISDNVSFPERDPWDSGPMRSPQFERRGGWTCNSR